MGKREQDLQEITKILKKVQQNAEEISEEDKKRLKSLGKDSPLLIDALKKMAMEENPEMFQKPISNNDTRTSEEIIADNYIALAKFAAQKMGISSPFQLKVEESEEELKIYALTPVPVLLDYLQFTTSDDPQNKELLLEIEALQSDLVFEGKAKKAQKKIIARIEAIVL